MESEEAGPHYWHTVGNVIAKYPVRPSPHDKLLMKHWLDYTINHYVCYDPCIKNARKYLRSNPPDLSSRASLSHWWCLFHNHVRGTQGKNQVVSCDNVLSQSLPVSTPENNIDKGYAANNTENSKPGKDYDKGVQDGTNDHGSKGGTEEGRYGHVKPDGGTDTYSNQTYLDVSSALKKLKNASTSVFKALCREFKVPYPDFLYQPCPGHEATSCTSFPVDVEGKAAGKATVYLNQYVYSPETIVHEFWHYYHKIKGEDAAADDEIEITKKAGEFIRKNFPSDGHDIRLPESKKVYTEVKKTRYEARYAQIHDSGTYVSRFPRYSGLIAKDVQQEAEDLRPAGENNPSREGFLRHFDGIYGHLEKGFGIPKEWLNYSYSPEIISTVTQTIVESNFSPVGSLVLSALLGLGLGGYVVMAKQGISQGDRLLLTEMSAHFTTNTIRYANKDAMSHVTTDIERLGAALIRLDFMEMVNIMVGRSMFGGYDDGPGLEHMPLPPSPPPSKPLLRAPPRPEIITPNPTVPITYDDLLLAYGYKGRETGKHGLAHRRAYPASASVSSGGKTTTVSTSGGSAAAAGGGGSVAAAGGGGASSASAGGGGGAVATTSTGGGGGIPVVSVTRTSTPTAVPVSTQDVVSGAPTGAGGGGIPSAAMGGPEVAAGGAGPMGSGDVTGGGGGVPGGPMGVGMGMGTGMEMGEDEMMRQERMKRRRMMMMEMEAKGLGRMPPAARQVEGPRERFLQERGRGFFRRSARPGFEQQPLYTIEQQQAQQDQDMRIADERRRRRLISGIDEEGFYYGPENESSNEGVASDYWGNSGRNSINLGDEGYYE